MRKNIIVLEKSPLAQNICRMILEGRGGVDSAMCIEDIDVLISERDYHLIIVGEGLYSDEGWEKLLRRNPQLKGVPRIFISTSGRAPEGFKLLRRPFKPFELQRMADSI